MSRTTCRDCSERKSYAAAAAVAPSTGALRKADKTPPVTQASTPARAATDMATPVKPQPDIVVKIIDVEEEMPDADQDPEPDESCSRAALQQYLDRMLLVQESASPLDTELVTSHTAAEIVATKLRLRNMRPPGRKLEGLRGVVARDEKRLVNAQQRLEAAEQEILDARAGHAEASLRLEEHRTELQALVSELALIAQVFQADSSAQLPPELASLNQQIASLNQQLSNQAMVAQQQLEQQLELQALHARQALGAQQAQINMLVEALSAAGMHHLVDAADPLNVAPKQAAACMAETLLDAIQDVTDETPVPAPFIVPTPCGRVVLSSGKVAAGRPAGKQLVLTPTDGTGLSMETTARTSPY